MDTMSTMDGSGGVQAEALAAFRRRKRLWWCALLGFVPATVLIGAVGRAWMGIEPALLLVVAWQIAFLAWCVFGLMRCPVCRGSFPNNLGMTRVWLGSAPLVHDCGVRLQ